MAIDAPEALFSDRGVFYQVPFVQLDSGRRPQDEQLTTPNRSQLGTNIGEHIGPLSTDKYSPGYSIAIVIASRWQSLFGEFNVHLLCFACLISSAPHHSDLRTMLKLSAKGCQFGSSKVQ